MGGLCYNEEKVPEMETMSDSVRDILTRGVAAAKAGDDEEARYYLNWALSMDGLSQAQEMEALFWLSEVEISPEQRRDRLETILAMDPFHPEARRKLAILDGRLDPDEIVDANALRAVGSGGPSFCSECGGPLVFTPDGRSRYCERCGWQPDSLNLGDESPEALLMQGIAAAKRKGFAEAERYLEAIVTRQDVLPELRVRAWLWLSGVRQTPSEKRDCLEAVLQIDPDNHVARKGLSYLERYVEDEQGEQHPSEDSRARGTARRFVCTQCGGKMSFDASGVNLRCSYCGREQSLMDTVHEGGLVEEQDFALALATAKGHSRPMNVRPFKCRGCGASFILAPGVLSLDCPYCGSAHVVGRPSREIVTPEGILPFTVDRAAARRALRRWLEEQVGRVDLLSNDVFGLYFPAWTFDVGGILRWRRTMPQSGFVPEQQNQGGLRVSLSLDGNIHVQSSGGYAPSLEEGSYALELDDVLVAACHTLPPDLLSVLEGFDLAAIQPYDPRYLADWAAELYSIPVSDASLVARERALDKGRQRLGHHSGGLRGVFVDSSGMTIYAYKLILLPLWLSQYHVEQEDYRIVVNGQTGVVHGQKPPGWFQKLLGRVF